MGFFDKLKELAGGKIGGAKDAASNAAHSAQNTAKMRLAMSKILQVTWPKQ